MKLLYVTNAFPYPLTTGYLRHYFLIKGLSVRHSVTLLSIVGPRFEWAHAEALAPFTERVLTFPSAARGQSIRRRAVRQAREAITGQRAGDRMRAAIEAIRREQTFDAALLSGRDALPAVPALRGLPVVVDLCDASGMRLRRAMPYAPLHRRPRLWLSCWRMERAERALRTVADHVTFVGRRDLEDVLGPSPADASVVPNGVDLNFWRRTSAGRGRDTIVFTGAMDYPPNIDAACHLVTEILPRVRRSRPGCELLIVGRDPSPALRRVGEAPGVTVTGRVDDVRPYLERATVFAAPLRFGAGVQNKLLEALAMAVPVVTSSLAADGLRTLEGGPPLRVADSPDAFATAVTTCLNAADRDPRPDDEGRAFVARHFVWERSVTVLADIFETLTRSRVRAWERWSGDVASAGDYGVA